MWLALFPMLSISFLTSFIEFFISRISVSFFFKVSISLLMYSLCSLICFLSTLNHQSVFCYILSSIFRAETLNSLSLIHITYFHLFKFTFWRPLSFSVIFFFFFCCLATFFIHDIQWVPSPSRHLCISGISLANYYNEVFLFFSKRWHWITSFLALWNPKADPFLPSLTLPWLPSMVSVVPMLGNGVVWGKPAAFLPSHKWWS